MNSFQKVSLSICLVGLFGIACNPSRPGNEMRRVGPDVQADLLIYFNGDASHDEIDAFDKAVLSKPDPEGRGYDLAPGIGMLLAIGPVEGHKGYAITFFPNATRDQREELMRAVRQSRVVYKILEKKAPDSVHTLR